MIPSMFDLVFCKRNWVREFLTSSPWVVLFIQNTMNIQTLILQSVDSKLTSCSAECFRARSSLQTSEKPLSPVFQIHFPVFMKDTNVLGQEGQLSG